MSGPRPCHACGQRCLDSDCGPADEACVLIWEVCHELGDHRRCERFGWPCEVADRHPEVRQAGQSALARTGRALAVVCLPCADIDGPKVLGTFGEDLWSAKGLRNAHARRHGFGLQERKGHIYVVVGDGVFL